MSLPDRYTCAELFRRLDDYIDKRLNEDEKHLVEIHLESCVRCAAEYKFDQQVIDLVREKLQKVDLPDGLVERLADRLRDPN